MEGEGSLKFHKIPPPRNSATVQHHNMPERDPASFSRPKLFGWRFWKACHDQSPLQIKLFPPPRICRHCHAKTKFRKCRVSGKKKAHKHKFFGPVTPPVTGGSPDREAGGQSFMCYPRKPKEHKSFWPDTRPGGPVARPTGKSFMCKSFCSLE